MPQTRANKGVVPVNSDAYNLTTDLATLVDSLTPLVKVANQTERDNLPSSIKQPGLVVARGDMPGVTEVYDGTTWWKSGGPMHAEFTGSNAPPNNTLWGTGPLTFSSATSINGGFATSPANSKVALPIGVYNIFVRFVTDITTNGTSGQIANDGVTTVYSNMDQIDGHQKFYVDILGLYLPTAQNVQFTWQTSTANANLVSTVRIDKIA